MMNMPLQAQTAIAPSLKPVAVNAGAAKLNPRNTMIQFVGTHAGSEPNPRVGVFQKFNGSAIVVDGAVSEIRVEIVTGSLKTPIGNLTNHLKTPDFFDTREFPSASFVSSDIGPYEHGTHLVNGQLTLMGETRDVSFPAEIEVTDEGVTLSGEIVLDRTEFGMSKMTEKVNKEVMLKVAIGRASKLPRADHGG